MLRSFLISLLFLSFLATTATAQDWPEVGNVDRQPLVESTKRVIEALDYVGRPISDEDRATLERAMADENSRLLRIVQDTLDPYCLAGVHINAESRVKVAVGPASKTLMQNGWTPFLVKVYNEAEITPELRAESPQAAPVLAHGSGARDRPNADGPLISQAEVIQRFLDIDMFNGQPLRQELSGLKLEYRIIQLYSRDAGKREAELAFNVGQGSQDLGFRNSVPILFDCVPATELRLRVVDEKGEPTTAAFVVKDDQGRVYPHPAKRLSPDFFFHEQVYRMDGETLTLPPGDYTAVVGRGPEYLPQTVEFAIGPDRPQILEVQLERWIHPAARGWYSGDHHVHAAGCAHYDSPTEGVGPEAMMRHILGEDLNVGCVLSWGPCWYVQKDFFEGKVSDLSEPNYLMRYDVEVSGFPSSHAGHLCLLQLVEDDYPGTKSLEDWPSWTLPVLQWGQEQGAVVGYSHSGWGLGLPDYAPDGSRMSNPDQFGQSSSRAGRPDLSRGRAADTLPDYAMPAFDSIGANEYIVTATHDACDFISSVDTPAIWELNIWYHTLNCGITTRISGETDFPCIYGERVGLGRIYVKIDEDQPLTYESWIQGVKDGRSYCGDGLSHLLNFQVNDVAVGEPGSNNAISQLDLDEPGTVTVRVDAAALLAETPTEETERIRNRRLDAKPYWHIERCRIDDSRKVPLELIVNGEVAATRELLANGAISELEFEVDIDQSSWIAVRILPSAHTNPIFVHVGGKPIRANRRSAEWCREAVDVCWNSKQGRFRETEKQAAKDAYDHARAFYDRIIAESPADE